MATELPAVGTRVRWRGRARGGEREHEGVVVAVCPDGCATWAPAAFAPDPGGANHDAFVAIVGTWRDHRGGGMGQKVLVRVDNHGKRTHYFAPRVHSLEVIGG